MQNSLDPLGLRPLGALFLYILSPAQASPASPAEEVLGTPSRSPPAISGSRVLCLESGRFEASGKQIGKHENNKKLNKECAAG